MDFLSLKLFLERKTIAQSNFCLFKFSKHYRFEIHQLLVVSRLKNRVEITKGSAATKYKRYLFRD